MRSVRLYISYTLVLMDNCPHYLSVQVIIIFIACPCFRLTGIYNASFVCATVRAIERNSGSVCVPCWQRLFLSSARQLLCASSVPSSSRALSSRVISIAPLCFTPARMVGASKSPDCNWLVRTVVTSKPPNSSCMSLRGRINAKQQENDHRGFFRHARRLLYRFTTYWTESIKEAKYFVAIREKPKQT